MKPNNIDWSVPKRQPRVALVIMIFKTFTEVLKNIWPVILIWIFSRDNGEHSRISKYEIIAYSVLFITLTGGLMKWLYFRFSIQNNELIVRSGWIKKAKHVIPLERINSVHLEQPVIHQLLNVVKLKVDTAGSSKTEVTIDCLHRDMAEALHHSLLQKTEAVEDIAAPAEQPIVQLTEKDLLKLSLTANHLETFFIILAFALGLLDNLSGLGDRMLETATGFLPKGSFMVFTILAIVSLLITLLISTLRVFLKYYNLSVFAHEKGFRIKAGLTTIKERVVSLKKLQYISWRSSWLRKKFGFRILKFHLAGIDLEKDSLNPEVPVTRDGILETLAKQYYPVPLLDEKVSIRMDSSFITRRFLIMGLIPAVIVIAVAWMWLDRNALWFLLYPLLILLVSWKRQRKFRAYALDDIFILNRGFFGDNNLILKWEKIQCAAISQSLFQRNKGLANCILYTATGAITMKFIPQEAAREVMNYALFRIETAREPWS